MSTRNVELVRDIYDGFAAGDVAAVLGAMSPDIVWNEAENFPLADRNPYRGPEAIAGGVFARLAADWDGFAVSIDELLDAGDAVVAIGRYRGTKGPNPVPEAVVTGWILLSGEERGGSDGDPIVTDERRRPGGKSQPAASRSAGEGGWWRRAPWPGYPARPAALSYPATFPGRSRPPPGLGLDPNRATGRAVDAQLVHIWRIENGKAKSFQQYTDTLQFARATDAQ